MGLRSVGDPFGGPAPLIDKWIGSAFPVVKKVYDNLDLLTQVVAGPLGDAPLLYGKDFGIKADGVTSDDVALQTFVAACVAGKAKGILPGGNILLTGAATIALQDVCLEGLGIFGASSGDTASVGTTILLTSTLVKPFICGSNWSMEGINFYWPNQVNGTTAYPALLNLGPTSVLWSFRKCNVINAYDFLVDPDCTAEGNFYITDCGLYACHDLLRLSQQGDSFHFTNNQLTPNAWFTLTGYSTACVNAVNAASLVNTIFHATAVTSLAWNAVIDGCVTFAWRYGFRLDAGAIISESNINMGWDGVQTLIDSSAGGNWAYGNTFTSCGGAGGINIVTQALRGNAPAFNMGTTGYLELNGFRGGANGSFIKTMGCNVSMLNCELASIGTIADGSDYYLVELGANPGGLVITILGCIFLGIPASTKVHGIGGVAVPVRLTVVGSEFAFFNDNITLSAAPATTIVVNNWSIGTTGANSCTITGATLGMVTNNFWDKPTAGDRFVNTPTLRVGVLPELEVAGGVVVGSPTGGAKGQGTINTTMPFYANGTQVLSNRQTGWAAPTGTLARTTFDQSTVTLPELAKRLAALITDLTAHGLIGT